MGTCLMADIGDGAPLGKGLQSSTRRLLKNQPIQYNTSDSSQLGDVVVRRRIRLVGMQSEPLGWAAHRVEGGPACVGCFSYGGIWLSIFQYF